MSHIDNIFRSFSKILHGLKIDLEESQARLVKQFGEVGLKAAEDNSPTGVYDKNVNFTTRDGKEVNFTLAVAREGGTLKKSWNLTRLKKSGSSYSIKLETSDEAPYAIYVNNGHRIVRKKITIGYVPGQFFLEAALKTVEKSAMPLFQAELRRVKAKHGL